MASLTRSASAVASKAIAAAEAEYGTLDQLFELVAKGRVLDVVLPRQGSDPAARLNLEAEGESTIGSRLVGADVTLRRGASPSGPSSARAQRRSQRAIDPEIDSARGQRGRGALKRPTPLPSEARRRTRPAAATCGSASTSRMQQHT